MSLPGGYHLHVLHERKAPYPTITSYKEFFAKWWPVSDGPIDQIPTDVQADRLVLWQMMGTNFFRRPARLVIHDYRSLSVGTLSGIKDRLKRLLNCKPDIRLFQTDFVRRGLGFRDTVPEIQFTLGVPSFAFDMSWDRSKTSCDFGYVGVVTVDREFDTVLQSFLDAYEGKKSFLLVGPADDAILQRFRSHDCFDFVGKLPHREALRRVLESRCGVSFIPDKHPYNRQIPTKLLEYAALGMPILANDCWTNIDNIERHRIAATLTGNDLFADRPAPALMADNRDCDLSHLDFHRILAESGLVEILAKALGASS